MNNRAICVSLLAVVLVFQLSGVSRFVYVWLDLAPDCPVVGKKEGPSCCEDTDQAREQMAAHCGVLPSTADEPSSGTSRSGDNEEDCPTCRMYAVINTILLAHAEPPVVIESLPDRTDELQFTVSVPDLYDSSQPRAPPHI